MLLQEKFYSRRLKNDALKQFAKHQGIIEKIADKLTPSN